MFDNPRPMIRVTVMTIPVTASVFMARAYIGSYPVPNGTAHTSQSRSRLSPAP